MISSVPEYIGGLKTNLWLCTEKQMKRSEPPWKNSSYNSRVERFISLWTKVSADQLIEHVLLFCCHVQKGKCVDYTISEYCIHRVNFMGQSNLHCRTQKLGTRKESVSVHLAA